MRGTTFGPIRFRVRDKTSNALLDLTGYTGQTQIRDRHDSSVVASGTVAIDEATSIATITYPTAQLNLLPNGNNYHWSVVLESPVGERREYLRGNLEIVLGATEWNP